MVPFDCDDLFSVAELWDFVHYKIGMSSHGFALTKFHENFTQPLDKIYENTIPFDLNDFHFCRCIGIGFYFLNK